MIGRIVAMFLATLTLGVYPGIASGNTFESASKEVSYCWVSPSKSDLVPIKVSVKFENGLADRSTITLIEPAMDNHGKVSLNFDAARRAISRCAEVAALENFSGELIFTFGDGVNEIKQVEPTYLMRPAVLDNSIQGLNFFIINDSFTAPSFYDIIDKDPFNRGANFDSYKGTEVTCRINLFLKNDTGFDVAFRDVYSTVIGLKFVLRDGNKLIQGNIGLSAALNLTGESRNILKNNEYIQVNFVSMSSERFSSRRHADAWASDGGCDFSTVLDVERAGILGEIMLQNDTEWRSFGNSVGVVKNVTTR